MIVHLERSRINLPGAVASQHASVRRQACATMAHLLVAKFSAQQQEQFSAQWVGPITRLLWTDADQAVAVSAAAALHQMLPIASLKRVIVTEFCSVPTSFFLVCDRVRLLMPESQCAPVLTVLAAVVEQSGGVFDLIGSFFCVCVDVKAKNKAHP